MNNIAILVGNSAYDREMDLPFCERDLAAVKELLTATGKYSTVEVIHNADGDDLKKRLRSIATSGSGETNELFFYFTGHGMWNDASFYFCTKNFDAERPNATGLSSNDLYTTLKLANANLIVAVFDACYSGVRLIKGADPVSIPPNEFKHLIQLSSSSDTQQSFGGDNLSKFTEKFCFAATRTSEGPVLYLDVINVLKDEFLGTKQTPLFLSQVTGQERFVDDARCFDTVRPKFSGVTEPTKPTDASAAAPLVSIEVPLSEKLRIAQSALPTREKMDQFISGLFNEIRRRALEYKEIELWKCEFRESSNFTDMTREKYLAKTLSGEKRTDEFVKAEFSRKWKKRDPFDIFAYSTNRELEDVYELALNCQLSAIELTVDFVPKFSLLRRIAVTVTCAPSLGGCYIFYVFTEHPLLDFEKYEEYGNDILESSSKFEWSSSTVVLADRVIVYLERLLTGEKARVEKQLAGQDN